ncbi:MarR family winged helix-turn-helix transcriptional regulator [Nocardioidaceae bacterium SCSIO 66511]|nr:MarR family winged helix-turn-helix transcriptional regulator [Nocardioidaceae bacterium SCSIO 66511]
MSATATTVPNPAPESSVPAEPSSPPLLEAMTLFSRAMRASVRQFDRLETSLRRTDAALLRYLTTHGDSRAGDIALEYGIDASVVSRQVGCLVERGYVERRTDPADARASLLVITGSGREQLAEFDRAYSRFLADRFDDWSDDQIRTAAVVLTDVATTLIHDHHDEKDS